MVILIGGDPILRRLRMMINLVYPEGLPPGFCFRVVTYRKRNEDVTYLQSSPLDAHRQFARIIPSPYRLESILTKDDL